MSTPEPGHSDSTRPSGPPHETLGSTMLWIIAGNQNYFCPYQLLSSMPIVLNIAITISWHWKPTLHLLVLPTLSERMPSVLCREVIEDFIILSTGVQTNFRLFCSMKHDAIINRLNRTKLSSTPHLFFTCTSSLSISAIGRQWHL